MRLVSLNFKTLFIWTNDKRISHFDVDIIDSIKFMTCKGVFRF